MENHDAEADLRVLIVEIKGKLDLAMEGKGHLKELLGLYQQSQDALNNELKKRLLKQENCPCQVRRDATCECPLSSLQKTIAKYVGIGIGITFIFQIILQIGLHLFFRR